MPATTTTASGLQYEDMTVGSGAVEIQRNIISQAILGL